MKYKVKLTKAFKKGYKKAKKRDLDMNLLKTVVDSLMNDIPLAPKYKDHYLTGELSEYRECHIQPNWLLIYLKDKDTLTLTLFKTGTHSDLFKK